MFTHADAHRPLPRVRPDRPRADRSRHLEPPLTTILVPHEDMGRRAITHLYAKRDNEDRTGIISFATFPVIWLFGMRNNVVLWVTGWDFATYNNFHRWAARISTLQAVVHSIGYTVIILRGE